MSERFHPDKSLWLAIAAVTGLLLFASAIPNQLGAPIPAGHQVSAAHAAAYQALPATSFDLFFDGLAGVLIVLMVFGKCSIPVLQMSEHPAKSKKYTIRPPPSR